jgi:hypothetical protein
MIIMVYKVNGLIHYKKISIHQYTNHDLNIQQENKSFLFVFYKDNEELSLVQWIRKV